MPVVTLLGRHRSTIASWLALSVAAGSLVAYAVAADGQKAHRADLNDGGVWVTNQSESLLGRENKPLAQFDAYVPSGAESDVLQDGSAVALVDRGTHSLTPVSAERGVALPDQAVAVAGPATLGGGTLAVADPETGDLWATRYDDTGITSLATLDAESKPLANVGADAVATVTRGGDVLAASATGRLARLAPGPSGLTKTSEERLTKTPRDGVRAITSVGGTPVVLDGSGTVIVPTGTATIVDPEDEVRLQQPGPATDSVLIAADGELVRVGLADAVVTRSTGGSGTPAAPVRVGSTAFAAWADGDLGTLVTVRDGVVGDPVAFQLSSGAELVFRVNRNQVLLNDVRNGDVWNIDGLQPVEQSDWESTKADKPEKNDDGVEKDRPKVKQPPKAVDDELGARPGRTTVLHVLDNDKVSGGGVLSIVKVEGAEDEAGARIQLAPDRQSLLLTISPNLGHDLSYRYTVDDGSGGKDAQDSAEVRVAVRTDEGTASPVLRADLKAKDAAKTRPVVAGGVLEVGVLEDWRDPEYGDPVSLDDSGDDGTDVTVTPQGLLRIVAPGEAGIQPVRYQVSTGGEPSEGTVLLNVVSTDSLKAVSPSAEPDVAAGEVGGSITIHPLDNDIPGADPTDPLATLRLGGRVAPVSGVNVTTDLESGAVTVRARKPGSYTLHYSVGFGIARRDTGTIRVVVDPAGDTADLPIATPDTATIRGTVPMTVDVLANDYDARGRLLAVQSARPVEDDSQLEVAVLDGRWLRISATTVDMSPVTQVVEYQVSNGAGSATGTVTVTQKAPLPSERNAPVTVTDDVTVRVADSVVVPVLENDATPSGDPMGLRVPVTSAVMGELEVRPALGRAYVVGDRVRYVAPAADEIEGPQTVVVTYVAENVADPLRPDAAGTLRVHLTPEPDDTSPNQTPTPRAIEGRVVEGDTTSLRLPLVGNDPDGDSVSIVGVTSAPELGRILSLGANTIVYQAFPGSTGTDEFGYRVADGFGATAEGTIRVAVTPPGAPQAPVAVADVVTADFDTEVRVDVLANDLRTPGTRLRIEPLADPPEGVALESSTGPITVRSTDDPRRSVAFTYQITNGLDVSIGEVSVRAVEGYNNPPVVPDAYAEPEGDSATVEVDLLASAYDIDGEGAPLTIDSVGTGGDTVGELTPTLDGAVASVPVLDVPQVIPFRVLDGDGAATAAVIYVPARPQGWPYPRSDALIRLQPGEQRDIPIGDLVADPEGDEVFLTLADLIVATPRDNLTASAPESATVLHVQAGDRAGPGAITFEVSDRAELADPEAHRATLTVPAIVGDAEAILNCPDDPLEVTEGGKSPRVIDIASVCHVWTPDPDDLADLEFRAQWVDGQQPADVEVDNTGDGIRLLAGVRAERGSTGTLAVSVVGAKASDTLNVRVGAAGPPSLGAITLDTEAGKPVSVDVATYARSPFGSAAEYAVTSVEPVGKLPGRAPVQQDGTEVTFTPDEYGTYRFRVTISDAGPDSTRPTASAVVTISVVSEPEPPVGLRSDGQTRDAAVQLSWRAGPSNGGSISKYTVYYDGGQQVCPSTSCLVTGLTNGKTYTFRVSATNSFGESEKSDPVQATPDRVPDAVTNLTIALQRDHQVRLTWDPPTKRDHSPIDHYYVSWAGGGSARETGAQQTSYDATVAANGESIEFTVWAHNAAGHSVSKVTVVGMGAGKPAVPQQRQPETTNRAGNDAKAVTIAWEQVAANGPGPVTYRVVRTGGGPEKVVCAWVQQTSCADDLANDGTVYSYKVQARNAEATSGRPGADPAWYTSALSAATSVEAAATPEKPVIRSFVATGKNGQGKAVFDVGAAHGRTNKIECRPSCGSLGTTTVSTSGASGLTATIGGFDNGSTETWRVRACNGSAGGTGAGNACSPWVSDTTKPYGPISGPSLTVSASGKCYSWKVTGNANGKTVTATVKMGSETRATWSTSGSLSKSGTRCPGYDVTKTWKVTVVDSAASTEQPTKRATKSDSVKKSTAPRPSPPTISNFVAVDGGCLCGGPFTPIQVGIAWDTHYQKSVPGAVCVMTMDSEILGDSGNCANSGHASAQWGVDAGYHKFCGYVRLPDGRTSNKECVSGTWDGH